jgi:hypothetical protein
MLMVKLQNHTLYTNHWSGTLSEEEKVREAFSFNAGNRPVMLGTILFLVMYLMYLNDPKIGMKNNGLA